MSLRAQKDSNGMCNDAKVLMKKKPESAPRLNESRHSLCFYERLRRNAIKKQSCYQEIKKEMPYRFSFFKGFFFKKSNFFSGKIFFF